MLYGCFNVVAYRIGVIAWLYCFELVVGDSSFVGRSGTDSVSVCFDPGSISYASTCKELDKDCR